MKTLVKTLRIVVVAAAIAATPHLALGAQKQFAITISVQSTNVASGVASTVPIIVTNTSTAGSFAGVVTNSVIISPAGDGVTASYSQTSSVTVSNSPSVPSGGSANLTLWVSATATAVPNIVYTVTVTGTNSAATGNTPIKGYAQAVCQFIVGTPPQIVWTPAGMNTNWSNTANWSPSITPSLLNDVTFFDISGTNSIGLVNNVVDNNFSIGSLIYGQTNNYNTTLILPGKTLTLGGDSIGLQAGTGTDASFLTTSNAITGSGGTLALTNTHSTVFVSQSHVVNTGESTAQATLDLSGLGNFTATVSRLIVGADVSIKGASGVLNLAKTNTVTTTFGATAPQIDVGDNTLPQGSPAIPSILLLGSTNAFFADSIAVGRGKTDGSTASSMSFNSLFVNPTAYFRGTNGNRVGTWSIGDGCGAKQGSAPYTTALGTCDFSLGTVNAMVDTMFVGKGADPGILSGANYYGNGTLNLGAGTFNVNTLEVGYTVFISGTGNAGTGTVNANGGALVVNNFLELGHQSGSSGTLNITNATVTANIGITAGGGTAIINLASGTLSATNSTATIGTTANPLAMFNFTGGTLSIAIQSLVPSVATTNLTLSGPATINISSVPALTGFPTEFPIIEYSSATVSLTGVALTLPAASPTAYGAYLTNDTSLNAIAIVFTNGPTIPVLTWDGHVNGNWDLTTTNWIPKSGPDTAYANGDFVTFNDSLSGTPNVNLTTALTPISVTASNSAENYVFSGTGSLGGSTALAKYGSDSLTLAETGGDNFSGGVAVNNGTLVLDDANSSISGGTAINGGTLQIGNNDANGTVPSGNLTDSGSLVFDNANNVSVTNTITGAGTLTGNDTNILTLTGNNATFTGTAVAAQGTLQIGSTNSVFAAGVSITVSNGATLDSDGQSLYNGTVGSTVTASGPGVGGNGAIVNNSTNSNAETLHIVNLSADTTFGGIGGWEIRNSSGSMAGADAQLNSVNNQQYNLTKVGASTVTLRGVTIDNNLENINIMGGGLHFTATATASISLGDPNATNTVFTNATVTFDSIGNIPGKNFVLTNGGTIVCSSTNTFGDSLTLYGPGNTISVGSGSQFTITTVITGNGGLSKNGSGPLFMGAASTYTGNTVISGGTLALYNSGSDGSISSSVLVNITGGALLDVSGRSDGTFTLASGQTLQGGNGSTAGSINGNFVASAGSFFTPDTGTTNTGSIAVSTNATLLGSATMRLNAAGGLSDQLLANSITYGGTLAVTNVFGTITNGQTFQLFVASNGVYNAGSFSSIALPTAVGLSWTTNLAVNGTITANVVNIPATQPNITGFNLTGTQLIISGTSSLTDLNYTYSVLNGTNLLTPLTNWTILSTGNSFNPGGNFRITNTVNPNTPQSYYMIRVP